MTLEQIQIQEGLHRLMKASLDHQYDIPRCRNVDSVIWHMCHKSLSEDYIIPKRLAYFIWSHVAIAASQEDALDLKLAILSACKTEFGDEIAKHINPETCEVYIKSTCKYFTTRESWIQQQLKKLKQ
jgi:hypothetical protein